MTHDMKYKKFELECEILSITKIGQKSYIHEYRAPEIASQARPGQFIQVRISKTLSPFLARPFSILKANIEKGSISILYKVFGSTTAELSCKEKGDFVTILGPIGNTFNTDDYENIIMVAGGIGVPPLYNVITEINLDKKNVHLFFGASSKEELYLYDELNDKNIELTVTTDDGSFGEKKFITEPLEELLKSITDKKNTCILTCGPMPMLRKIQQMSLDYGISAQISVETVMACGIGLCQGCVLPKDNHTEEQEYSLVCCDGPIYRENELRI